MKKYKIDNYLVEANSPIEAMKAVQTLKDSKVKDVAFDRSTIDALIADEQAAIAAYNVAIANLKGKLSDEAIKVLQVIRDDEQNHVANLNAILSNNITEKNLEDSIKDSKYVIYRRHDDRYLGNGGRSWVTKTSNNVDMFNSKNEALTYLKKYVDDYDAEIVEFN